MIYGLADKLWHDSFWQEVGLFSPEILLAMGMCAVIIVPFFKRNSVKIPAGAAILSLLAALAACAVSEAGRAPVLFGMMVPDPFSKLFKILLLTFTLLIIAQWLIVRDEKRNPMDVPDFLCLLLGATFGMALMASASNLLSIFIAVETASLSSFALAGFRKDTRPGTEGALKYVVFGAASSAIMVYGMSLIYGACGSLQLEVIAQYAATNGLNPLMGIGILGLMAGIGFKLSAVPMHFWCPDVFEGAPIEVTTFLSVASKGAAVVLLVRVLGAFGFAAADSSNPGVFMSITAGIAILGGVTATWGNLVAYHQTNIKRLLAYSSIAHAGYMIMAAAFLPIAGVKLTTTITTALLFYLVIYMFMNLGAFTVAAMIARQTGSEDINDYADLRRRSPVLALLMMLCLLSLFGMPGLGGFMGKIFLAVGIAKVGTGGLVVIAVLLVNTLISLFYYMRPVMAMYLKADEQNRPAFVAASNGVTLVLLCAFMLVVTGVAPSVAVDQIEQYKLLSRTPAQTTQKPLQKSDDATIKDKPQKPDSKLLAKP